MNHAVAAAPACVEVRTQHTLFDETQLSGDATRRNVVDVREQLDLIELHLMEAPLDQK